MADPHDVPKAVLAERKLSLLVGYADELEALVKDPTDGPRGNVERRAVERLVQLVVEVTTDLNGLVAIAHGLPAPATSRESFDAALRTGALTADLVSRYKATYVGLRNRIVHDYDILDDKIVVRSARRLVQDARLYARLIRPHLARLADAGSGVREEAMAWTATAKKTRGRASSKSRPAAPSAAAKRRGAPSK